jgi:hypothetical protein
MSVTFDEDSLSWREGDAATHTLKYAYLAELRVHVRRSRPPALVAVERQGRRWEMVLAAEDVARAQGVLDVVDGRLPEPAALPSPWPKLGRSLLMLGAMIGVAGGQLVVAIVALLAIFQPVAPLMAAAGISAMAAGAVLVRQSGVDGGVFVEIGLMLLGFGFVLLLVARTKREETISMRTRLAVGGLGILAAFALVAFVIGGIDPIRLHQSGQTVTAAPVLLLAFAGALTLWKSRAVKYAAIPVLVLAAATTGVASTSFLDRFADDIFISPAPGLHWTEARGGVIQEFGVPFTAESLQLSPRGRLVSVIEQTYRRNEHDETTFHIGRAGEGLSVVRAHDLLFVDEAEVLFVRVLTDGVELTQADARTPDRANWRVRIADLREPQLSFDATARQWRLVGWSESERAVAVTGELASSDIRRQEWTRPMRDSGWVEVLAASGDTVLLVEAHYKPGLLDWCGLSRYAWLVQPDRETRFRFIPQAENMSVIGSRFDTTCFAPSANGNQVLCSAFDGTRTRFISVDASSREVSPLGWIEGRYVSLRRPSNGWLSGWRNGMPTALNLERHLAVHIDRTRDYRAFAVTGSDDLIATISYDGRGSTIRLLRLSDVESSSARVQ